MKLAATAFLVLVLGLVSWGIGVGLALNESCGRELPGCPTSDFVLGLFTFGGMAAVGVGLLLGFVVLLRWVRKGRRQETMRSVKAAERP